MARRAKLKDEKEPGQNALGSRLELIKRRHRELILQPRKIIAADLNDEFGNPFEDLLEVEQFEYAEPAGIGQL